VCFGTNQYFARAVDNVACSFLENYIHVCTSFDLKFCGENSYIHMYETSSTHIVYRPSFAFAAQQTAKEMRSSSHSLHRDTDSRSLPLLFKERLEEYVVRGVASGSLDDGRMRAVSLVSWHGVRGRDVVQLG
jgi:hypothetical protein